MPPLNATQTYTSIAVGDFNGDGIADLAAYGSLGEVDVLYGVDAGGFASPASLEPGGWRVYVSGLLAVGDLDGDGIADLAGIDVYEGGSQVTLDAWSFLGSRDAGLNEPGTDYPLEALNDYCGGETTLLVGITLDDFNADGQLDAAVAYDVTCGGTAQWRIDVFGGDAGYLWRGSLRDDGWSNGVFGLWSGDVNGDGVSDLAVLYRLEGDGGCYLQVLFGNDGGLDSWGAAGLQNGNNEEPGSGLYDSSVRVDCWNDLSRGTNVLAVAGNRLDAIFDGQIHLFAYDSDAGLIAVGTDAVPDVADFGEPTVVIASDLDGDGTADLVASQGNRVLIWFANDSGYEPALVIDAGFGGVLAIGDLNGDGLPDIAVASSSNGPNGGALLLSLCQ